MRRGEFGYNLAEHATEEQGLQDSQISCSHMHRYSPNRFA